MRVAPYATFGSADLAATVGYLGEAARLGVGDGDEPQIDQPPVMGEPDRIGRIERQARRRQTERRRLAPHPRLHQRAAAAAFGLLGRDRHREGLGRDPRRVHRDAPRLDEGRVVILVGAGDLGWVDLQIAAAETLTRVLPPESGADAAAPSLQRISAFTEIKTVWHPKSMS